MCLWLSDTVCEELVVLASVLLPGMVDVGGPVLLLATEVFFAVLEDGPVDFVVVVDGTGDVGVIALVGFGVVIEGTERRHQHSFCNLACEASNPTVKKFWLN